MKKADRLFIGIKLSEETKKIIAKYINQYDNLAIRWLPLDNLHITLVPPFCTTETENIIFHLNNQKYIKPFNVELSTVSFGPSKERASLIWVIIKESQELQELKKEIFSSLHLKAESRPNIFHITIARFKYLDKESRETEFKQISLIEKIDSFEVIESIRLPYGANYITRASIKL